MDLLRSTNASLNRWPTAKIWWIGSPAGLCLFQDRYSYSYDGSRIGDSPLEIGVESSGTISVPKRLPTVSWRAGLDLNPLNIANDDDLAWLRACIWPEHEERRRRLDLAATIVAQDPPRITRGDPRDATLALIETAPRTATKVVFHSAVLADVDEASRRDFAATMRQQVGHRDDIVWLSNEGPAVVAGMETVDATTVETPSGAQFHLGRNGTELIAVTDPHGRWVRWLAQH